MPVDLAVWIVRLAGAYLALGIAFAVGFALVGARRIDPDASAGTWGFRVLVVPGAAALWPLLAVRWARGSAAPPEQRDAHRARAETDRRGVPSAEVDA